MTRRLRAELNTLILGKPAPENREMLDWALDLIHAAKTGQFPYPGGLRDQPLTVQQWFRYAQMNLLAVEVAHIGTP